MFGPGVLFWFGADSTPRVVRLGWAGLGLGLLFQGWAGSVVSGFGQEFNNHFVGSAATVRFGSVTP